MVILTQVLGNLSALTRSAMQERDGRLISSAGLVVRDGGTAVDLWRHPAELSSHGAFPWGLRGGRRSRLTGAPTGVPVAQLIRWCAEDLRALRLGRVWMVVRAEVHSVERPLRSEPPGRKSIER
jgi:hypothetical protein